METRDGLNNHQVHSPESQKVARLVDYLLRLATLRTKLVRDIAEYEKVLRFSTVPHERGCFTQSWGRDEEHEPDEATRNYVKRVLDGIPEDTQHPDLDNFKLWRPKPSDDAPFGFKGRVVIMEQMVVTEEIQKFIRGDVEDVHPDVIEKTARSEGMLTLEQVGVLAALRGETTLEEINRVI